MQLPRPVQNSLLLLLLVFAAQKADAQYLPADDFFNSGAQFYISNNIPSALEKTENGLKIYPDNEKLKQLEQLLKQQQQQNQQQQNQQNQSQQSKSDQQKNQQQQDQSSPKNSEDQPKPDKQNQADQKKADEKKQQEQQASAADQKKAEQEKKQQAEGQPVKPGEMTPEEAKRLLDAQKGDEQVLQFKPQGKPQDYQHPVKDW
ncbi:MAG TPA: hypothetical protein VIK53_07545 [Verrucomicrobiae bacterium]